MKKFVFLVSLLLIPLTLASETQRRFRIFVHVFEAKQSDLYDTYTRDFLETKLKKEFRLLEDVDIVEVDEYKVSPNWHFTLQVCYLQNTFTENSETKRQVAIAFDFAERVPLPYFFKGNRYPESHRSPVYPTSQVSTLSIPPPVPASEPTVINRDWELIATLERDIRQKHWHEFYVQKDIEPKILNAFRDGKDLFFEIVDSDSFVKTDFYLIQPNPPTGWVKRFYPSSGWFDHWGPEKATAFAVPVDRSNPGLVISLDPGFPGSEFQHPDNRNKKWVGGDVEFRTKLIPEKKTNLDWAAVDGYPPHIKDGIVLKVYVR